MAETTAGKLEGCGVDDWSRICQLWQAFFSVPPSCASSATHPVLRSTFFWNITQRTVVIPNRRFDTTRHGVTHYTLRNIPEEPISQLHRGRGLKSHAQSSSRWIQRVFASEFKRLEREDFR